MSTFKRGKYALYLIIIITSNISNMCCICFNMVKYTSNYWYIMVIATEYIFSKMLKYGFNKGESCTRQPSFDPC